MSCFKVGSSLLFKLGIWVLGNDGATLELLKEKEREREREREKERERKRERERERGRRVQNEKGGKHQYLWVVHDDAFTLFDGLHWIKTCLSENIFDGIRNN